MSLCLGGFDNPFLKGMRGLFRRFLTNSPRRSGPENIGDELDTPLLWLSPSDPLTMRQATQGIFITGVTGSGKTSGSGAALARSLLVQGCGALVLTVKPDECPLWQRYARETGREEDLIIFSPDEKWRFNFMDYELRRPGAAAGFTENLVSLFTTVLESTDRNTGQNKGESYWNRALKQLLRNTIDLLKIAKGRVSLPEMYDLITSAPTDPEQLQDEEWCEQSFCCQCIYEAEQKAEGTPHARDFEMAARFFVSEFVNLAEKTRSIIVSSFTTMADGLIRGPMYDLFCTTTNVVPEMTHEGAIVVVNLPVKEYAEVGQAAQIIWKYLWQRATERRDVTKHPYPTVLWADESQYFLTGQQDMLYLTTARSARAVTVFLTQSISTYYAVLGGEGKAHAEVDSLCSNLTTKIFHAASDSQMTNWAANLFAKSWQQRASTGFSESTTGGGQKGEPPSASHSRNASVQEALEFEVQPQEFTTLRTGGPHNDCSVDAIIFQGGRIWKATGKNYLKTTFQQ